MELSEILRYCDHTLLSTTCTFEQIQTISDQAMKYSCASVCIPPCHVSAAKRYAGQRLAICTVIGFPNGYSTTATKVFETRDAVLNGADEIDMVINLTLVKAGKFDEIRDEIVAVREACPGKILKVIIECCVLTQEEKIRLCGIVSESGADYIKTSTGFSTGGATREDVRLMKEHCDPRLKVKAAGGIATVQDAQDFVALGAERLGTSRIVKIAEASR